MGNENTDFNRLEYFKDCILAFIHSESKGIKQVSGSLNFINYKPDLKNIEIEKQKRQILEACLRLFKNPKFKELIEKEKQKRGIENNLSKESLHQISLLANILTDRLSEIVLSDRKRSYNMSQMATKNTVSTAPKDLNYTAQDLASKDITDMFGHKITIQHIGRLDFNCPPSANDYIYKYRVTKQMGKDTQIVREIFSNIDLNRIDENPEYAYAVANEILSENNMDLSMANDYLGELDVPPKGLEDGKELFQPGLYTYKIPGLKRNPLALYFDGTKIEAIRAYNKKLEKDQKEDEIR